MSFTEFGLAPKLLENIVAAGYTAPTPIQTAAIPTVREGRDLIGIAQTGTGKTAAFVLPILDRLLATREQAAGRRQPRALVVAPTRELAAQIEENVRLFSRGTQLRSVAIFGGVGETPQIQAVRSGVDVLVATPGRLLDLLGSGHVSLRHIQVAVLDEADRMLDMGFLPQIRKVIAALPRERQTLLFSATLSRDIEKIASEMLRDPKVVEIGRRANPAESVKQVLHPVDKARKVDLLLQILRNPALDSVLVFSRTKHGADKIARKLAAAGIPTATIHSNRSQSQRTSALAQFKQGRVRVLVATDIAARGIDVEEISHVVNFDFPPAPEDYVHRIGRTGRAAATGDAISFITPDDHASVTALERMIGRKLEREVVPGFRMSAEPEPRNTAVRPSLAPRPRAHVQHAPRHTMRSRASAEPSRPRRRA
ncbi:MAG TPA: DEAD/DEAH box helicase, partial [Thermoanaerobaculia bacterium]|nr:DEAD/DEAH box helicase [Thermoanaerobaculia bacterium]